MYRRIENMNFSSRWKPQKNIASRWFLFLSLKSTYINNHEYNILYLHTYVLYVCMRVGLTAVRD